MSEKEEKLKQKIALLNDALPHLRNLLEDLAKKIASVTSDSCSLSLALQHLLAYIISGNRDDVGYKMYDVIITSYKVETKLRNLQDLLNDINKELRKINEVCVYLYSLSFEKRK